MMLVAHTFGHGRSVQAVAAVASHLPLRRFLAIKAIEVSAALIWSALYTGGGYVLGGELQTFELVLRRPGWFGAALVLAGSPRGGTGSGTARRRRAAVRGCVAGRYPRPLTKGWFTSRAAVRRWSQERGHVNSHQTAPRR